MPRRSYPQLKLRRANQQWMLDHMLKTTGRVQNFAYDQRSFPRTARSYWMIPRVMGRIALRQQAMAQRAEAEGQLRTAFELYVKAAETFRQAQHPIYLDDDPEKLFLCERLAACYDSVIAHAPYPVERVEVPWGGRSFSALFHLLADRRRAPTVIYVPGMDQTKEVFPSPEDNPFAERGMHVLSIDGPGQGTSNLRKIRVTEDNYERAVSAAVDYLLTRPEVDPDRLMVCGVSMGSFWTVRSAAHEPRLAACATCSACYGDKFSIFEQASPRFKQMFMYMSGMEDEAEFDAMAARMTTDGFGGQITCPTLLISGEYDPLCPLENALALFDELAGPKEMWIFQDEFHSYSRQAGIGGLDAQVAMADWLRDVAARGLPPGHARRVLVRKTDGRGIYGDAVRGAVWEATYGIGSEGRA